MVHSYWQRLREVFTNKVLILLVVLTTAICFGFTITNFSIGVDDPAAYHYLWSNHKGSLIQQGRLLHVVYNLLTNSVEFLPFINDFLGASLLALSALLFCALFQLTTGGKLSTTAMAVFCCVYISSPIMNEKFLYNLDVVVTMSSYCTCALALMYAQGIRESKANFFKAVGMLMLSIASYETFGFVYFCGVFAIFMLRMVVNGERLRFKAFFLEGLRYALVMIAAFVIYYALVVVVQLITGQYGVFQRFSVWSNPEMGPLLRLWDVTNTITLALFHTDYFPYTEFLLVSALGAVLFLILSLRRKNVWLLVSYVAMFIGNFFIHYACGFFMNRAAQTFCLFVAFVVMMLVVTLSVGKRAKKVLICASAVLVLAQSAELNRWFYNDYIRYQKEAFATNAMATRLLAECDVSKPVVFADSEAPGYLDTYYYEGGQINGNSVIYWAEDAFDEAGSPLMHQLFQMHGYDFLVTPTQEQIAQAAIEAENMPPWPAQGSILETEEYIIVKVR